MGAHNSTVDDQVFHVWVLKELLMHPFPDSFVAPACEAFIDAVPVAVAFWKKSPLGTTPTHPQHGLDELTAVCFLPDVKVWTGLQTLKHLGPLVVRQFYCWHAYYYLSNVNRTYLSNLPMPRQTEPNANNALGDMLRGMMSGCEVRSENTQTFSDHPGRHADVLIVAPGRPRWS